MATLNGRSILDKAKPVNEWKLVFKGLIYGPEGVGKTTLAASFPGVLYVDNERSADVLSVTPGLQHTPLLRPENTKELQAIVRDFIRSVNYETLVIDSISQLQDDQLIDHMNEKFKDDKNNVNRHLPLFREFRISTQLIKEIFRDLQRTEKNVILIGHERKLTEKKDVNGEMVDRVVAIGVDMTPRLNESVRRLTSNLLYMDKESDLAGKTTRKLYVNATGLIRAKNRLGLQQPFLVNPSWKDLVKEPLK